MLARYKKYDKFYIILQLIFYVYIFKNSLNASRTPALFYCTKIWCKKCFQILTWTFVKSLTTVLSPDSKQSFDIQLLE